jgi:hypothetical protein
MQKMPIPSALLRFIYLFDENADVAAVFVKASVRRKRSAHRCDGTNAPLYTKLSRTTVNFFPLVYFGCQCSSIRDCTAPIRHPLKLGGQQWRRREKRKQRRRRPRSVGRRSRRCRCRSSIALEAVEDRVTRAGWRQGRSALSAEMIRRDAPAQVNDRGRRRGRRFGLHRFAQRNRAAGHGGDGDEKISTLPWHQPVDQKISDISPTPSVCRCALLKTWCFAKDSQRRPEPNPRRRFSLP